MLTDSREQRCIRSINLGVSAEPRDLAGVQRTARTFFATADCIFADGQMALRTRRVTTQPRAGAAARAMPVRALQDLEASLEGIWLCVPGPQFLSDSQEMSWLDCIPELVASTENVFFNALVGSRHGIHLKAISRIGTLIREIAGAIPNGQGNFRFAAIANVRPHTPYFPAAYHEGEDQFSIALELAPLANAAFRGPGGFDVKLEEFGAHVARLARDASRYAMKLSAATGTKFAGIDFSLAPFPGAHTSAVGAIEALIDARIGSIPFILGFHAVNQVLATTAPEVQRVGYNGTMLSVAEDSVLAERVAERAVSIKDMLLYATVCGCGLDMLPLSSETPASHLSALVQATAVIAHRWDKPLIARLLPTPTDSTGCTCFRHEFLVNTHPFMTDSKEFPESGSQVAPYYRKPGDTSTGHRELEELQT